MITIPILIAQLLSSNVTPVVIPVNKYAYTQEARKSTTPYSELSGDKKKQVNTTIFNRAKNSCDLAAINYKSKRSASVSPELKPDYDFIQTPSNVVNKQVSKSPSFIKVTEIVVGFTKGNPPKPIYEATFTFVCNGYWYNTNPGKNN